MAFLADLTNLNLPEASFTIALVNASFTFFIQYKVLLLVTFQAVPRLVFTFEAAWFAFSTYLYQFVLEFKLIVTIWTSLCLFNAFTFVLNQQKAIRFVARFAKLLLNGVTSGAFRVAINAWLQTFNLLLLDIFKLFIIIGAYLEAQSF